MKPLLEVGNWQTEQRRIRRDRLIASVTLVILWLVSVLAMAFILHHFAH